MDSPKIYLIAAVCNGNGIGKDGQIPWHVSEDLKRFRDLTTGHPVIMGRKTYESIGKPLSNRQNIVVSSSAVTSDVARSGTGSLPPNTVYVRAPDDAIKLCGPWAGIHYWGVRDAQTLLVASTRGVPDANRQRCAWMRRLLSNRNV